MNTFRSRYARRVLVPVMAVSVLSACHGWKVQEMAPSQLVYEQEPWRVRLTMLNGDRVELGDPLVSGGDIIGHPIHGPNTPEHYTLRVARDSVAGIEISEIKGTETGLLVLLGLVIVGAAVGVWVLSNSSMGCCE
jgi:hypothetical protein